MRSFMSVKGFLLILFLISFSLLFSQETGPFPFQNPDLSVDRRVRDLVGRMTLKEKISQMMHTAEAVPRLGIPEYNWWNEALHGVARAGTATVFPQAIGLAAAWDTGLMHRIATVIGTEARAKHHEFVRRGKRGIYQGLTFWSPNINIFRDPRWGRGQETFGEDPYLSGRLAVAFVRGMQGDDPRYLKTVATPKHFAVHSGPEPDRHRFDARADERDLRETYLPAFEACIREGKAFSVMCAYNRFDGEPCCSNTRLLSDILRKEWGFCGYVVSDCWAVSDIYNGHLTVASPAEAAARAVRAGCDLSCGPEFAHLADAVKLGYITEAEIDTAVVRLFTARMRLGMFDPPENVPYAGIAYEANDSPEHDRLALQAARASIVLLKNQRRILPLSKTLQTVAVIGPNADDVEVLLGNYNGTPANPITPLQGIRAKIGAERVLYAQGCHWAENMPALSVVPAAVFFTGEERSSRRGLLAEYFDNHDFTGVPALTRIDAAIDFNWRDSSPDPRLDADHFAVRWSGFLMPSCTGEYELGGYGFNGFRIFLQDSLLLAFRGTHHPNKKYRRVYLQKDKPYRLRVEFFEYAGDAHMQLIWSMPQQKLTEEALQAADRADAIILLLGLSPRLEGEEMDVPVIGFKGGDRIDLGLPQVQEQLLHKIVALSKPTVLVLLSGSAVAIHWAEEHVPAILQAWYPGQRAGCAIADVLFGDYNPGGRLPVTFYKSAGDLPPFEQYAMQGRTYRYFAGEPLYAFGYGLSYTQFAYSDIKLQRAEIATGDSLPFEITVRNVGTMAGDEVIQVYLTDEQASAPVAIRSLTGFRRIHLQPNEQKTLQFVLTPRALSVIDTRMKRCIEPGWFSLAVGGGQPLASSREKQVSTQVRTTRFRVVGETIAID